MSSFEWVELESHDPTSFLRPCVSLFFIYLRKKSDLIIREIYRTITVDHVTLKFALKVLCYLLKIMFKFLIFTGVSSVFQNVWQAPKTNLVICLLSK